MPGACYQNKSYDFYSLILYRFKCVSTELYFVEKCGVAE